MAARFVAGIPRVHSKDYGEWRMFQAGLRDRHGACARSCRYTAVPHSRAAKGAHPLGKVEIDLVKEGKKLLPLENFW